MNSPAFQAMDAILAQHQLTGSRGFGGASKNAELLAHGLPAAQKRPRSPPAQILMRRSRKTKRAASILILERQDRLPTEQRTSSEIGCRVVASPSCT